MRFFIVIVSRFKWRAAGLEANLATVARDLEHRVSKQARESQGEPGRANKNQNYEPSGDKARHQNETSRFPTRFF